MQPVAAGADEGSGIDACAVDHDGEQAHMLVVALADDGYRLASFDGIAHMDQILSVVGIDRFETIGVADDDDVALGGMIARETDLAVEHSLDGIALLGSDFQLLVVVGEPGLAYGQGKTVLGGFESSEVYAKRIGPAKQAGCLYLDLLHLGSGELVFCGGSRH